MVFTREECRDLETALSREWLETNGIGGYASSTIPGANTRRYHGLLVAALDPPLGRRVLLSKVEETVMAAGRRWDIGVNLYPGVTHPQGHRWLAQFAVDPVPVWRYEMDDIVLTKRLFMVRGRNTTIIAYRLEEAPGEVTLALRPLLACRDFHHLSHGDREFECTTDPDTGCVEVECDQGGSTWIRHQARDVSPTGEWYRSFEYPRETYRGLDGHEDLFCPCELLIGLEPGEATSLVVSPEDPGELDVEAAWQERLAHEERVLTDFDDEEPTVRMLVRAADQFLVQRGPHTSVLAGYPWFSDWGRDAMIALPGLTLRAGRPEEAKRILQAFLAHTSQGMIPNRFPDGGEQPEYNTADATLWLFAALRKYVYATGDFDFVREQAYPILADIIDWHLRGTRYGIRVADDGLLEAGEPGTQLTWMDAKVGDWVVTPRQGKAVELNALWYGTLRVAEYLAGKLDLPGDRRRWREAAGRVAEAFEPTFWVEEAGYLCDVVRGDERDTRLRPNQIIALALPWDLLGEQRAGRALQRVTDELLTPYGLRTLAPSDPEYRGRYGGDVLARDGAYHQGTVWPWLLGPYFEAYFKLHGWNEETIGWAREFLQPLQDHLREAGLGSVSEIFDGDPPHAPRGCFAQAWSVAALLNIHRELLR